jgi:hypothetical protein
MEITVELRGSSVCCRKYHVALTHSVPRQNIKITPHFFGHDSCR